MNAVRIGSMFGVAWTNLCAILVSYYNTTITQHVWTTILNLAGIPVTIALGCGLVVLRCRHYQRTVDADMARRSADYLAELPSEDEAERSAALAHQRDEDTMMDDGPTDEHAEAISTAKTRCKICTTTMPTTWWATHVSSLKHQENLARAKAQ